MSGLLLPNGRPAYPKEVPPKFEDLTPAQQEALAAKADATATDTSHHVTAAYIVVLGHDGGVNIESDLSQTFTVDRPPTAQDIMGSAAVVQASVAAQITAIHTQQAMLTQARAMAQQQQQDQAVHQMQGMNLRS